MSTNDSSFSSAQVGRGNTEVPVVVVAHQIGSGANGGLQSLSELVAGTPKIRKIIVTNLESSFTALWRRHAEVVVWKMEEHTYLANTNLWRLSAARRTINRVRNSWRLACLLLKTHAKVVHFNERASLWNCGLGAKLTGRKIILNVRDTLRNGSNLRNWKIALLLCDSFLVLSQEMIASWKENLWPLSEREDQKQKFEYIYSVVNLEKLKPVDHEKKKSLKKKLSLSNEKFIVGYIARVDDKKNQLGFIKNALPLLRTLIDNIYIVFVGDFEPDKDPYAAACLYEIKKQSAEDNVRFVGYSNSVFEWYQSIDTLVLASRREGLPRCMIEGLACGTPMVTFDVCSAREILHTHECGIAVPHGNYVALASALSDLQKDSSLRNRFQELGPIVAQRLFSINEASKRYSQLITRLSNAELSDKNSTERQE